MPELNIARTGVLDYWADLAIVGDKQVFNFNQGVRPDKPTLAFLQLVCHEMGFAYSDDILPAFVSGEAWQMLKNFPELEYFRDVCFYSKYLLCTDPTAFPQPSPTYTQKQAELRWQWVSQEYRWQVTVLWAV